MKKLMIIVLSLVLSLGIIGMANATVLTFDDLSPCTGICGGIGTYGGLSWSSDFHYMHTPSYDSGPNGYKNGTVSGEYVAFNSYYRNVSVSDTSFDFTGAYFASAWRTGLNIRIQGMSSGSEIYAETIVVDWTSPTWFQADFLSIDELRFSSSGGTEAPNLNGFGAHFAMDDFTINESEVPEPGTLLILGSGLIGLAAFRRKLKK